MNEQTLRDIWYVNPYFKANISSKLRKDIMIKNDLRVIFEGKSYEIKFKNMGGGIWQTYIEKMIFNSLPKL